MRDYLQRNKVRNQIDDIRHEWSRLPAEHLPPGFDIGAAFKHILACVSAPEVAYRIDQLAWSDSYYNTTLKSVSLPSYNNLAADDDEEKRLFIRGLTVVGPIGRKRTWKVVCDFETLTLYVFDRFGLDRKQSGETLLRISRTPDNKILRYPTEQEAKETVEAALLKIGLVGPLREVDEMHEITGYDA